MKEQFIIQRRNRLKKHYTNTSNVLLYGYTSLSDGARITFQVIEGFDWEDVTTHDSKGYVFPSVKRLAEIRNTTDRTIRNHIAELINVKLLTRKRRKYRPSILYIEEVSEEEANKYLEVFADRKRKTAKNHDRPQTSKTFTLNEQAAVSRTEIIFRSPTPAERKIISVAYRKEDEVEENEINVNENSYKTNRSSGGMSSLSEIMKRFDTEQRLGNAPPTAIDKNNGSNTSHVKIVPHTKRKQKPEKYAKRDYFAEQMAIELQDSKSLGCFRVIAEKVPEVVIYEVLGAVKETWMDGKIRKSKGALFIDIIKTYCEKNGIELFERNSFISI